MKKPAHLLALLLLALSCSDGSLVARGQMRAKKNRDRASGETPYVCLDKPIDLPACTFGGEAADRETRDKFTRHRRELSDALATELDGEDSSSDFGDNQGKSRAVIVMYKIEGCVPSRLPFDLPICKEEDSVGRIVEVRRLFPFNVMGLSGYNSGTTLVFPEVDVDQWRRFVNGPWTRPADIEDSMNKIDGTDDKDSRTEVSSAATTKIAKRKKVDSSISKNEKKTKTMLMKLKKFDRRHLSRKIDDNVAFTELPTVGKQREIDDRHPSDSVSCYEARANSLNRIDDRHHHHHHHHQRYNRNIDPPAVEKAPFARRVDEFPYAEAIPYDPEKLRVPRTYSEFPYRESIVREPISPRLHETVEDERFNGEPSRLGNLPYAQVISHYSGETDFSYDRDPQREIESTRSGAFRREAASGLSNRMLAEGDHNYGSPYTKFLGIPQDRKKLEVTEVGSEFPYIRAIPYDPAKLRVTPRRSEFPCAKAIPYDPKKLFEESSRGIIDVGSSSFYSRGLKEAEHSSKSSNSRVVPFDSRMVDAAKKGRIFPYGKAIPVDTSRIVEGMELSRTKETERIEAPVRDAKIIRSERVPGLASDRQIEKDQRMLENILNGREVRRSIINTGNEDYLYEVPLRGRVARSAMEADVPGDISFDNDNSETPRQWSEFPYSKAIPFDPSKLRQPRSTVEDYVKATIGAPQDLPYTKVVSYDPWKLAGFKRKKGEAPGKRTIDDESKLSQELELSRLGRFTF